MAASGNKGRGNKGRGGKGIVLLGALALASFAFMGEQPSEGGTYQLTGGFRFNRLIGKGLTQPISLSSKQIVFFFIDDEHQPGFTLAQVRDPGNGDESVPIWVTQRAFEIHRLFKGDFIQVHFPVSAFDDMIDRDDERSMEVKALWINRGAIEFIGPSKTLHIQRRRLGKIYTRDGKEFELYESLQALRKMLPDVPVLEHSWRPR